jgi:hypothetical protein
MAGFLWWAHASATDGRNSHEAPSEKAGAADANQAPQLEVSEYERLLRTYFTDDGWVDYAGLARERALLNRFLEQLATVSPAGYQRKTEQLAFWINSYNAFTLAEALDTVYGKRQGVRQVSGFFDKRKHAVAGEQLTLDEIEKRGRDLRDPRIHFAIVCASTSCPKLQRFAYTGEKQRRACRRRRLLLRNHRAAPVLRNIPRDLVDEAIVVDNGSTDGTARVAESLGAWVVCELEKGYGAACLAGIERLRADIEIVVFLDGDYSDHPEELELLVRPVAENVADLVIGSRRGPTPELRIVVWHFAAARAAPCSTVTSRRSERRATRCHSDLSTDRRRERARTGRGRRTAALSRLHWSRPRVRAGDRKKVCRSHSQRPKGTGEIEAS